MQDHLLHRGESDEPAPITRLDPPGRDAAFRVLFGIILLEPLIIIVVLAILGVRWWLIVAVMAMVLFFATGVLLIIVHAAWRPFASRYPAQSIGSGAVSRHFQSFSTSRFTRFNSCVRLIADDRHLHIDMPRLFQWLGARRASLPWLRMSHPRKGWMPGMMNIDIDGRTVSGPEWCMKLAVPEIDHADAPA